MIHAEKLVQAVDEALENINSGNGTFGKFISDDEIYNNVNTLLTNANHLVVDAKSFTSDVQNNPKNYIRAYFAAKREESKK